MLKRHCEEFFINVRSFLWISNNTKVVSFCELSSQNNILMGLFSVLCGDGKSFCCLSEGKNIWAWKMRTILLACEDFPFWYGNIFLSILSEISVQTYENCFLIWGENHFVFYVTHKWKNFVIKWNSWFYDISCLLEESIKMWRGQKVAEKRLLLMGKNSLHLFIYDEETKNIFVCMERLNVVILTKILIKYSFCFQSGENIGILLILLLEREEKVCKLLL